jgi:predicted Ser/Thr protein kinase
MSAHAGEERLGPYRLHAQLGEGGMGVVYLASGPSGEQVAVKVLRQGIPAEATARRRLAREVEMMRRVHSPYVAEVLDADVEGSPPYIVTRYVAGRTLEDVVAASGPITGPALARLASGLASALVAVHDAGIVHRDLKPGNVMLVDREPVVIDFGIAQAPDATRLTMTGMFMGTPGYLAPEIIEGRSSGPAADIHSWGATLAYAATGHPPFGTGQFEAIFYRIVHGQPELADMPAALSPLVLAALARDPARRPSAAELAQQCAVLDATGLVAGSAGMPQQATALAHPVTLRAHPVTQQVPPAQGPSLPEAVPGLSGALADAAAAALTAQDVSAQPANGLAAGAAAPMVVPPAPPPPAWAGTRPIAIAPADDFADLLPPVKYGQPNGSGGTAQRAGLGGEPGLRPGYPNPAPAGTGPDPGITGYGTPAASGEWASAEAAASPELAGPGSGLAAGSGPAPARRLLVIATVAALVAVSVLLPLAGTIFALVVLLLLRASDVTTGWLGKRRSVRGPRRSDAVAATAFYPWGVCRSALRFLLLSPLALLCGAAAAVLTIVATGSTSLPRAGGYAVGAVVACYFLGPGSAACRRPLSRFYGAVTRTLPAAALATFGVVALAVAMVGAAATLAPGYWPDQHLGDQLQMTTILHPGLSHLTGNVTEIGRKLAHWFGRHG